MINSEVRFSLDLQKHHSQISIPVTQGDTAKSFLISLKDGGEPYFIETGVLAMISIKRPTGTFLQMFCNVIDNTTIKYDFSQNENTAAEDGVHDCEIIITGADGGRLSSAWFTMVVSRNVVNRDDINLSDEDLNAIDAMVIAEAARQSAEEGRVNAEAGRVDAEENREASELLRKENFDELVERAEESIAEGRKCVYVGSGEMPEGYHVQIDPEGEPLTLGEFKGEKGDPGSSGVYLGSGNMPDGYNVQIDPSGTGLSLADLKGEQGIQGIQGEKGERGERGEQGIQGIQGEKGERGEAFSVARVYSSVAEMNADFSNPEISEGSFVTIDTGSVEDADTGKLFVKGPVEYRYLTDLSGAAGMKGDRGERGEQGIQGERGEQGIQGERGEQGIQGIQGIPGVQGERGIQGVQGERGPSGVYVGSGEMPEDCDVQVDPEGIAVTDEELLKDVVPKMPLIDAEVENDPDYKFAYDFANKYNRVYVEKSGGGWGGNGGGVYNKYVLSSDASPVYDPDFKDYKVDENGNPCGVKLDSIPMRLSDGHIYTHSNKSAFENAYDSAVISKGYDAEMYSERKAIIDSERAADKAELNSRIDEAVSNGIKATQSGTLVVLDDINPVSKTLKITGVPNTAIYMNSANLATASSIEVSGTSDYRYGEQTVHTPKKNASYTLSCDFENIAGTTVGIAIKPENNSILPDARSNEASGTLTLTGVVGDYKYISLRFYSNMSSTAKPSHCIFTNIVFKLDGMEIPLDAVPYPEQGFTIPSSGERIIDIPAYSPILMYTGTENAFTVEYSKDISKHFATKEELTNFVDTESEQNITGLKNFINLATTARVPDGDSSTRVPNTRWVNYGFVKKTDYATTTSAGIVKIASASEIDDKASDANPIVPATLDYAVKKAIADCKLEGTDNAWTEEEKASARTLLGINSTAPSLSNAFTLNTTVEVAEGAYALYAYNMTDGYMFIGIWMVSGKQQFHLKCYSGETYITIFGGTASRTIEFSDSNYAAYISSLKAIKIV